MIGAFRVVAFAAAAILWGHGASAFESVVTVRFGEQETCKVRGVTEMGLDEGTGTQQIRFDLASLPRDRKVTAAKLKFWVDAANEQVRRSWGFQIWRDRPDFDGFKMYDGPTAGKGGPLDVKFPYNIDTIWLCEFDVTPAVARWVRDPQSNRGLAARLSPINVPGGF